MVRKQTLDNVDRRIDNTVAGAVKKSPIESGKRIRGDRAEIGPIEKR
jgi:hypothetical protein